VSVVEPRERAHAQPVRRALHLPIGDVGPVAARAVAAGGDGCVRAVFARSAYVEVDRAFICVGVPELGCGALNALVTSGSTLRAWLAQVAPGERVTATPRQLRIGGMRIDFARARCWHPPQPALPVDHARLAQGVVQMRRAAIERMPDEGLAFLVAEASPNPRARVSTAPADSLAAMSGTSRNPLAPVGHAAASVLQQWLARGARADPAIAARPLADLIGLGPGLTPSGDDFLGGALVALHAFGRTAAANSLAAWLLPLGDRGTHPISAAHLRAAAAGFGGEALHACLCALAAARDAGASLTAISAVGHTSGWDALAGALTVAAAI